MGRAVLRGVRRRCAPVGVRGPDERVQTGVRLSASFCQTHPPQPKSRPRAYGGGHRLLPRDDLAAQTCLPRRPPGSPPPARRSSPPAAPHRGAASPAAPVATRRCRSNPSGPPSSATRCSWSRASGGIRAISSLGTYGAFTTSTSIRRASEPGSASYRSPSWTRSSPRLRRAHATAAGSTSAACRSTDSSRSATAIPIAPVPQHRSTTTRSERARRCSTARSTSRPVRRRGTKTPGATATRSPQNSAQPTTCSSGSPATRRATMSSRWPRVRASPRSTAASSSANTQPAARSSSTSASGTVTPRRCHAARSASAPPAR